MKRDARIGMAVVLVLGLGVTLLVGRALYKRGGSTGELEGEVAEADKGEIANPSNASTLSPGRSLVLPGGDPAIIGPVGLHKPGAFLDGDNTPEPDHEAAIPNHPNIGHVDAPSGEMYAYTVTGGDSPWKISSKIYGDGKYTQKIVEANGGMDAKKMTPGTIIKIPAIPGKPMLIKLNPIADAGGHRPPTMMVDPVGQRPANPAPVSGKSYKVESGDTLASIAKKAYGSSGQKTIQLIVAANHGLDAAHLKIGQQLTLPAMK